MNKLILVLFLLFSIASLQAQNLENFNDHRLNLTANGMLVLGTWATANLTINPILQLNTTGSRKYFHQMNAMWGAVNLGIAGLGYYHAIKGDESVLSLSKTITEQQNIEKLLLFNAGLDVAYLSTGFFLRERSKTHQNKPERLLGFGNSLILQGAWLFAFDLGFYLIQNKHGKGLGTILDGLAFSPTGFSLTLPI